MPGFFSEGYAQVKIGDQWGFIDGQGRTHIKPIFEEVRPYRHGLAWVNFQGQWAYVDLDGQLVWKEKK